MALIHISGKSYELIHDNRNGWNPEAFRNRYSEVLERYDYIIGDWGYSQLRLKGFFRDNHQKATKDSAYSSVSDYINEYCNFGCAYFILEKKQGGRKEPGEEDTDLYLDYSDDPSGLDNYDLQAAVESAVSAAASAETASTSEAPKQPSREFQQQYRQRHSHSQQRSDGGGRPAGGDGQGRRKEHPYRSKSNRGGGGERSKKPVKAASSEAAAASEPVRGSGLINKEAGRS